MHEARPALNIALLPMTSLTDRELITRTRQHHVGGCFLDDPEVDVELRTDRKGGHAPKQLFPAGARFVGRDGLRHEPLAEREPRGTRTVVVDIGVHRPLEKVARVWCKTPHPGVEMDHEGVVVGLTELDEAEAFAAENNLQ